MTHDALQFLVRPAHIQKTYPTAKTTTKVAKRKIQTLAHFTELARPFSRPNPTGIMTTAKLMDKLLDKNAFSIIQAAEAPSKIKIHAKKVRERGLVRIKASIKKGLKGIAAAAQSKASDAFPFSVHASLLRPLFPAPNSVLNCFPEFCPIFPPNGLNQRRSTCNLKQLEVM